MTREEAAKVLKLERDSLRSNPKVKVDQRLYDAYDVAIKELEQTRWIPVSERLPEKYGEYLVTVSSFCGEIVFKCSFATDLHKIDEYEFPEHKRGFYGIDSEWGSYEIDNVIAWMPSPEPYKEESEVEEMGEQMEFPETFEKFAKEYGFKDNKEVYTNGSDLIPIFRVKQWIEHDNKLRRIETDMDYHGGADKRMNECPLAESEEDK